MVLTGETEVLTEVPVTVPLCPPHNAHGLVWERTRAYKVKGWRQTTSAMAHSFKYSD
jgi:hypothetical protein